jgi:pilus assembly protein CpaC
MEKAKYARQRLVFIFIGCLLGVPLSMFSSLAADNTGADVQIFQGPITPIHLKVNEFSMLKSKDSRPIKRPQVVNPAIAEIVQSDEESRNWVTVRGVSAGTTQLTLWDDDKKLIGAYELIVAPNNFNVNLSAAELKKGLHDVFPEENVSIKTSGEFITLTGTVSSSDKLAKILKFAQAYAPKAEGKDESDKIINLLQVGGIQQVMLEVRIAEISKTLGNQLGVNFSYQGANAFGLSLLDNLTSIPAEGWPGNPILISNSINAALGFVYGDPVTVAIDALQEDGMLHILAKPTLIAQSGQNASFLAGGEFPFPVSSSFEQFSIEWKPFGIGLNFTPTVLGNDTISLVVAPEVSELDFSRSVSYAGYVVPSIDTRRMSTVVELKDNQSFAIAGLLKNYVRESVKKFPLLGDIPILGVLFRSSRYQKDETELLVVVTPHLVKPTDAGALPLPTDSFVDPTPFEFMMLGMLEKWHNPEQRGEIPAGQDGTTPIMEGNFGYIIPE